jgi:rhodanese-related sulfurtransferase
MMRKFETITWLIISTLLIPSASLATTSETDNKFHLDAVQAYEMKSKDPENVLLIDIRTLAEIRYTGIATIVDANIPYRLDSTEWKLKKDGKHGTFKRPKNTDFIEAVGNLFKDRGKNKDTPLIVMCTDGTRAHYALKHLKKAGYSNVYAQDEGFEGDKAKQGKNKGKRVVDGWKNRGLPWSYDLLPEKMYFNFDPQNRD